MKYSVKLTNEDVRNLDAGFLAINNAFCLVLSNEGGLDVDTWPGGGGTYFTENPELENVSSGDTLEVIMPDGTTKSFTMPYHF
jgi:hypothetical protein